MASLVATTGGFGHDFTSGIRDTSGATRPYFNGQNWVNPQQNLTPEQQNQLQSAQREAQARFSTAARVNTTQLLDMQARQTELQANARAADLTATGYDREAQAYEAGATTAEADATLAQASGQITAYQDLRKYHQTAGSQAAIQAGNGFKQAGSALYVAKSSLQQANISQQVDVLNGTERQIGYLETAAASRAQGAAAGVAATSARSLSATDTAAAGTIGQQASDLSTSLTNYYQTVDPTSVTPEDRLTMSLLSSNPDQALSDTANHLSQASTTQPADGSWDAAAGGGLPTALDHMPNLGWGIH